MHGGLSEDKFGALIALIKNISLYFSPGAFERLDNIVADLAK